MADEASKINHDSQLLLDQQFLRLPYELLRKNFRSFHVAFETQSTEIKNTLKDIAQKSLDGKLSKQQADKELAQIQNKLNNLKRKLATSTQEEDRYFDQIAARSRETREFLTLKTVDDVKYEPWSRRRLNRYLIDYCLRHGHLDTAVEMAKNAEINELVDIDAFVAMDKIQRSLRGGSVQEALTWCKENKKELRKMQSNLEFMLRCQQYIEMVRTGKKIEAINHARKYIIPFSDQYREEVETICGLLAHGPNTTIEEYASQFSPLRWHQLADAFTDAYLKLLNLPNAPLLHIALFTGLSALKTPACHGAGNATTASQLSAEDTNMDGVDGVNGVNGVNGTNGTNGVNGTATGRHKHHHLHGTSAVSMTRVCPTCSTELNELARNVRYAHHSKSRLLDQDLIMLPNNRIYGVERLREYAAKSGLEGKYKDLITGEVFEEAKCMKVFVT